MIFERYRVVCEIDVFQKALYLLRLRENFFNENIVQYFNTDLRWVAGDMELNDTNGDGDFEIIVWNYNRHESQDFPLLDITI